MMMTTIKRVLTACTVAGIVATFPSDAAWAMRRVALVVGNSAYQHVPQLPNPARDAQAIADLLRKSGFDEVELVEDVGNLDFKRAMRRFEDAAIDSDIAVVYFAGHGIEIEGTNYLIPVNAKLASDRDAEDEAITLSRLVRSAEPAKRLRLIILDACRDNPFGVKMKRRKRVATRAIAAGLAKVEPTSGNTLIAYASKAGSTAEDGAGQHSPFTAALLKNLVVPGLDVRLAFGRVRDEVLKRTHHRQEPFVYGSLGGSTLALVPPPLVPKPPSLAEARGDYELVERIGGRKAWEVFLAAHSTGLHAKLAREQIARLDAAAAAKAPRTTAKDTRVAALEPQAPPSSATAPSQVARAWDKIKDSGDPVALRAFISRYPDSVLALTAQKHLDALERSAQDKQERERKEQQAARRHDEASQPAETEPTTKHAPAADGQGTDHACRDEERRLSALKASGNKAWVRIDLQRLQQSLACRTLRPAVVAALESLSTQPKNEPAKNKVPPEEPAAEPSKTGPPPEPNTPKLVRAAQLKLGQIGCFDGAADGRMGPLTRAAIKRYLSHRKGGDGSGDVTESLVTDLQKEKGRVCPLVCGQGETARGDRCVATARAKPAVARQREKREDRAARPHRATQEAVRSRPAARPRPRVRQEAYAPRQQARRPAGSGMIGIGF
jgi:peptidoglycan hydrolase-like protein with peptidoglycan-binding domain